MFNIKGYIADIAEGMSEYQSIPYMTYTDKEYSKKEYIYLREGHIIFRFENTSSLDWSHPKNGVTVQCEYFDTEDLTHKKKDKIVTAINLDKEDAFQEEFDRLFRGHSHLAYQVEKMKNDVLSFSQKMEVEKQYAIVTDILTMGFWELYEGWRLPRVRNPAATTINTIHKGKLLFPDRKKRIDVQLVTGDYNLDKFVFPNIQITKPAVDLMGQPHRIIISEDIAVMKQVGAPYLEALIWKK